MGSRKASRTHTSAGHRAAGRRSGGRLLAGAAAFGVLTVGRRRRRRPGDRRRQPGPGEPGLREPRRLAAASRRWRDDGARACRDQVAAAGVLVSAARTGIAHLETQVGAHQAWAAGDLDEESRDAQLRSTTLAGPDDLERYADAERDYDDLLDESGDSCTNRSGSCPGRMQALRESMEAATAAMDRVGGAPRPARGRRGGRSRRGRRRRPLERHPGRPAGDDERLEGRRAGPGAGPAAAT